MGILRQDEVEEPVETVASRCPSSMDVSPRAKNMHGMGWDGMGWDGSFHGLMGEMVYRQRTDRNTLSRGHDRCPFISVPFVCSLCACAGAGAGALCSAPAILILIHGPMFES